ncbi:hypothetical protein GCM10025768_04120 [Microbacterium pseudoresistens]|uniref:Iron(III) transport system substrate-binding protein n=1 Tax=Microbacterium pseudoresistens TaxID=640634 RepID=A0A7Y9JN64_9MICO|nr:extracellular solute-binding protein [Microbacterium pseudoresistens]NYD54248.1 iron(III) transport system substrate-binding protein [Microbacterium pseudoresistens]
MKLTRAAGLIGSVVLAGALVTGCAGGGETETNPDPETSGGADGIDALVEAAKEEGSLTVYASAAESTIQDAIAAFNEEYPEIQVDYFRGAGTALFNRFETEAEAGSVVADVFMPTIQPSFISDHPEWFIPMTDEVLPTAVELDWPADFRTEYTIQTIVEEIVVIYNTNNVSDPPKTWEEALDPAYKGKIILVDPEASPSYMSWYAIARDAFGDDFIRALGEMDPIWVDTGATGAQQVATGSKDIVIPTYPSHATGLMAEGAPIDYERNLDPTQGITTSVAITADAPHPNAAKLFANWLLTPAAFNAYCDGGAFSSVVPGTNCDSLASNFVAPVWDIPQEEQAEIVALLGR